MTWTFLSSFKVKPAHDADFAALIPKMEAIADDEPGTLVYKFYRRSDPHSFAVFESFVDEAADQAHQANPKSAPIIARMIDYIDGTYTRDYLLPL